MSTEWKWGDGWSKQLPRFQEDFDGEKYAELSLFDGDGKKIMDLGVDHYNFEWDGKISPEHRALIAQTPELLRVAKCCLDLLKRIPLWSVEANMGADICQGRRELAEVIAKASK